jgi:hypothetical protein
MNKVKTDHNWREVDILDEEEIQHLERLRIQWADGTVSEEIVEVHKSSYTISDHGSPWEVRVSKAYIPINYKGITALVRLAGQNILAERIDKVKKSTESGNTTIRRV